MLIIYGTKVFTKDQGYYGDKVECPNCHKTYKQDYVKYSTWAHLSYIPIFPVKKRYYKMCPICGHSHELKSKEAKAEMIVRDNGTQNVKVYAKHILSKKPAKWTDPDISYEIWAKDLNTNEDICIRTNVSKAYVKEEKKARGLKSIEIIDVQ